MRRLAIGFFLDGEVLYKKGKDQILLRCVDANKAKKIVDEIHEGVCGTHASRHIMARQIMKVRYYWMTLEVFASIMFGSVINVKSTQTKYMFHLRPCT